MSERLPPIAPGEILHEEFMIPLGISMNALARDIDVPPNRISEIVRGKRVITADTPELWLGLQAEYDLRLARQTTWPRVEPRVRVAEGL